MNQSCFICNNRTGSSLRNATTLFGEHNTLQSGKSLSEVVSEILDRTLKENREHTNILCKKCYKACTEYDAMQVKLKTIKTELLEQFQATSKSNNLSHAIDVGDVTTASPKKTDGSAAKKTMGKIVLPASKLQPLPPDLLLRMGKMTAITNEHILNARNKPISTTATTAPATTVFQTTQHSTTNNDTAKQTDNILTTLVNTLHDDMSKIITQRSHEARIPLVSLNRLPKNFLSSGVDNSKHDEIDDNIDDEAMEIDEDCAFSVVPVTSKNGDLVLEVKGIKTSKSKSSRADNTEYLTVVPSQDGDAAADEDARDKYLLGNVEILNEGDDDDDNEHTIVLDGEHGSILRMANGQKFIYDGKEISLLVPDGVDSQHGDGDNDNGDGDNDNGDGDNDNGDGDNDNGDGDNDSGDGQESNDESQIELQVSGDEETANAIIAAAQEKGGAFIKVESGEMYRVQSVHSAHVARDNTQLLQVVARDDDGKFRCLLCDKNADRDALLKTEYKGDADSIMSHLKTSHDARIYICQLCGIVMRRKNEYTTHIAEHAHKLRSMSMSSAKAKAKLHSCSVCKKTYSSRLLLEEHGNTHTGARPHACRLCHKAFASKYTHQAHMKTHKERPRPFKCGTCEKSFFTQHNLTQHEKTHTAKKSFVCNVCGKGFSTQHNLEVHGVVHSGNKPFVCGVCGKAFARRAEVRDHMRTHTGERPYACDICGATFAQNSNLYSHKRATHLDERRYSCALCPKRFKRRRLLDYHTKAAHTGERPLKCEVCGATFVYPEHYKKHVRIHSGERPYVCEICGKSFNSRDNRNTHRFVHSDKKPYECLACGHGFMRKQLLYAHMNTSGHLAESIVVNQPRVTKVTQPSNNALNRIDNTQRDESEFGRFEAIFEVSSEDLKLDASDHKTNAGIGSEKTNGTLLDSVNAENSIQFEQTEIMASDENGETVRLIQIELPDGNSGWMAVND